MGRRARGRRGQPREDLAGALDLRLLDLAQLQGTNQSQQQRIGLPGRITPAGRNRHQHPTKELPVSRDFTFGTALARIGRQAIERARHGKEFAIQARLRAQSDELRARVAELIARKSDPVTWTPDEHATFILATEVPTGFEVRTDAPEPIPANEPKIPF